MLTEEREELEREEYDDKLAKVHPTIRKQIEKERIKKQLYGKIIEKLMDEGWDQELNQFDDQLKSYLPKETKKFISIDDLGQTR